MRADYWGEAFYVAATIGVCLCGGARVDACFVCTGWSRDIGQWRLRRKMEIKSHLQRGIRTEMKAGMDMRQGARNIARL